MLTDYRRGCIIRLSNRERCKAMVEFTYPKLNTIYTDEEYMAQGFTKEECAKVRRSDELYNKYKLEDELSDEEWAEYTALVEELGL